MGKWLFGVFTVFWERGEVLPKELPEAYIVPLQSVKWIKGTKLTTTE